MKIKKRLTISKIYEYDKTMYSICSIGGLLGIALGLSLGAVGSKVMVYATAVSPVVILISFSFSMFIGVFFGYYPAKKAAELDPIEALRYE